MIPLRDRLPTRTTPFVNYAILVVNAFVFLWIQVFEPETSRPFLTWGFIPSEFLTDPVPRSYTLLSAMFLHQGWIHAGGNLLFLWVFGDNVEDALGHMRYVTFYVAGGVFAAIAQLIVDPSSTLPMVGASGAIAAVLAGYVSLFPRARVLVLLPIVVLLFFEFPAWLVVLEWFALNVVQGVLSVVQHDHGGVAWFAHIGGFLAGLILIRIGMIGRQAMTYDRWSGWRAPTGARRFRVPYQGRDDRLN